MVYMTEGRRVGGPLMQPPRPWFESHRWPQYADVRMLRANPLDSAWLSEHIPYSLRSSDTAIMSMTPVQANQRLSEQRVTGLKRVNCAPDKPQGKMGRYGFCSMVMRLVEAEEHETSANSSPEGCVVEMG